MTLTRLVGIWLVSLIGWLLLAVGMGRYLRRYEGMTVQAATKQASDAALSLWVLQAFVMLGAYLIWEG